MSDIASYRVAETATQDKKLTKQDLNRIFWNIQSMSFSYNYEKLQTIGFAHCMIPVLERLYADADKATRIKAMKRHLEFYNSQVNTGALILGVTAALEEKTSEEEKEAVVSVKAGLMGPFAGLGDSLLKFTWLPICGSIGAAFALQGNIIGPLLMFILFNIVNVGSKYFFIHYGYNKGVLNRAVEKLEHYPAYLQHRQRGRRDGAGVINSDNRENINSAGYCGWRAVDKSAGDVR